MFVGSTSSIYVDRPIRHVVLKIYMPCKNLHMPSQYLYEPHKGDVYCRTISDCVFLANKYIGIKWLVKWLIDQLFFYVINGWKIVWFICLDHSRGYQANRPHSTSSLSNGTTTPARSSDAMATSDHHNFKSFLWQHISLALTKGFDDNVGRNPAPQVFEVGVLLGTWEGDGCHCSRRALPIFFFMRL